MVLKLLSNDNNERLCKVGPLFYVYLSLHLSLFILIWLHNAKFCYCLLYWVWCSGWIPSLRIDVSTGNMTVGQDFCKHKCAQDLGFRKILIFFSEIARARTGAMWQLVGKGGSKASSYTLHLPIWRQGWKKT